MTETQAQKILRRLKAEGELTNVQLNQMGIYRYAARIMELRRAGHNIISIHEKGGRWRFKYVQEGQTGGLWSAPVDSQEVGSVDLMVLTPSQPEQTALALGDVGPKRNIQFL